MTSPLSILGYAASGLVPLLVAAGLYQGSPQSEVPCASGVTANTATIASGVMKIDPELTGTREIRRSHDGLFYLTAQVDGQPVRFIVDTGASVTVLTSRDAATLGLAPDESRYDSSLITVGGSASMAWTRISRIELEGHILNDMPVAIVQSGVQTSLLGQDALSALGRITIERNRLIID